MVPPLAHHRYSVNEYLQFERTSDEKHEYRSGQIIAMADLYRDVQLPPEPATVPQPPRP